MKAVMSFVASYFPALIIAVGAVAVAGGGFWASWRQTQFNEELTEKNNKIISLQDELKTYVTGGDNFCFLQADLPKDATTPVDLYVINEKNTPIFNVTAVIHPVRQYTAATAVRLGTVLAGAMRIEQKLIPGNYQINIVSRNGAFTEMLSLVDDKGNVRMLVDVFRFGTAEKLFSNH
jgi:hypothetical protein